MPGPAPDPNRRRRNVKIAGQVLPAEGRDGVLPGWPLQGQSDLEAEMWGQVWSTPQAVAWERLGWVRAVARYVRLCVAAEEPGSPVSLAGEVRQMEDRLGLSPMAMRRLEWTVGEGEAEAESSEDDELSQRRADREARVG